MKLNPQQSPLYGQCVLTVCLEEEEACWPGREDETGGSGGGGGGEGEKVFYLLFSGSTQRHLTTTLQVSHVTLQAVCPAHNACEQVVVTLCVARPDGQVDPRSQQHFLYVPDLALDMAHFLLNNGEPQGVMLLDDQQVPLKECERLDQSLALALRHLTLPRPPRAEPGTQDGLSTTAAAEMPALEHTDVGLDADVQASACAGEQAVREHVTASGDHATDPGNSIDVSQWGCHRWSALLHFAASRGLRRVALFLLRQPAAREALRQRDAQGETPASLAQRKGRRQLAELLTRCETTSVAAAAEEDLREESEGCLQIYPEGRAFQCHPGLGTYTLTLPVRRETQEKQQQEEEERPGGEGQGIDGCLLREEVEELRRLVQIHREQKGQLDFCDSSSPTPGSAHLHSGHGPCSPAGGACPKANGQSEGQEPAQPALEAPESCKATETQASERGVAAAAIASCNTGSPRPIQEEKAAGSANSAAGRHPNRGRKNRKRTSKNTGNDKSVTRTPERAINNCSEATGSKSALNIILPKQVIEEKSTSSPEPERTPFPTVPLPGSVCDTGQVVVATSIAEKQEGGDSELGLETSASATKGEDLTAKRTNQNHLPGETHTEAKRNPPSEGDAEREGSMGQGQSLDPDADPGEPASPDPTDQSPRPPGQPWDGPKSPGGKPRRMLWRDGGWSAAKGWPSEAGPETAANTVWYRDDSAAEPPPAGGAAPPCHAAEGLAKTTWYGDNMAVDQTPASLQSDHDRLEVSEREESASSHPPAFSVCGGRDSLEHEPCFQESVSALSQVRGSGARPAASHVPGAQRQEASRKQQDEGGRGEGEAERKERGAAGGARGGDDRRRANSEESVERGEEEEEEEEPGPEEGAGETADKGRKKRRRKRARRGAAEAKLSSSSSTEAHVPMEAGARAPSPSNSPAAEPRGETRALPGREGGGDDARAPGGGVVDGGDPPSAERPVATQQTRAVAGGAVSQLPCPSESVLREEVDAGTMRLPSQTEDKSADCGQPIVALADTDSHSPAPGLASIDSGAKEVAGFLHSEGADSTELTDFTEAVEGKVSFRAVECNTPTQDVESTVSDLNVDVVDAVPTELDYGHSDAAGSSEGNAGPVTAMEPNSSSRSEAPEAESDSADHPVDPVPRCVSTTTTTTETADAARLAESTPGTITPYMEATRREGAPAEGPPQQGEAAADVSALKTQEGSADATAPAAPGLCFGDAAPRRDGPGEDAPSEAEGSEAEGSEAAVSREEAREARAGEKRSGTADTAVAVAGTKSCTWDRDEREEEEEEAIEWSAEAREEDEGCGEDVRRYDEELAATAVAVVTVAVALALANVELSQRLAGNGLGEGKASQESSLTEQTRVQPSSAPVGSERELPVSDDQPTNDSQAEVAAVSATGESHAPREPSGAGEYRLLDDTASADDDHQLNKVEEPQVEESLLPSKQAVPEGHVDLEHAPEENLVNTEQVVSETMSVQNDLDCLDSDQALTIEAANPAQADLETPTELNEVLATQLASPTSVQSEGQLCQDDRVPCPVVDTGQGSGAQLHVFDSSAAENPVLKECADDSHGEFNCSLYEEPLCLSLGPERGAKVPLVTNFLETVTCEAGESPGTSAAGAAVEPASEARVMGGGDTVVFVCEDAEGECLSDGSAEGQRLPPGSEVCGSSGGVPHDEGQRESSHEGAVACDDEVSKCSLPAREAALPVHPDGAPPGTCSGAAHSDPPSTESARPGAPGDGTAQPPADVFVLDAPMEFQSSSSQREGDQSAVAYDGDGMFQDGAGDLGCLDTVDGCTDQEGTSGGEETQRIMVTAPHSSTTESDGLQEAQPTEAITEGALRLEIQRDKEAFYPLGPCEEPCAVTGPPAAADLGPSGPGEAEEEAGELQGHRGTSHDAVGRVTPSTELDDCVFKKPAPPVPRKEFRDRRGRSSWSSTEDSSTQGPPSVSSLHSLDTASMDTTSMDTASMDTASMDSVSVGTGEPVSPWSPGGPWKSGEDGRGGAAGEGLEATGGRRGEEDEEEEEEKQDGLPDNPVTSAIARASNRSLSPFRRHSWESGGANAAGPPGGDPGPVQRSAQRILPVEVRRAKPPLHRRSYSLEGLEVGRVLGQGAGPRLAAYDREDRPGAKGSRLDSQERGGGSLVSLTEEEQEGDASSPVNQSSHRVLSMQTSCPTSSHHQPLTKSISMVAISQRETDGVGSCSTTSGSLEYSICEEEPGPLRSSDRVGGVGVSGTKVSRTFSYLRSKMSKKNKGSDRDKRGDKERESKEREKRPMNGHALAPAAPPPSSACQQCPRLLLAKDTFLCTNCGVYVHKNCRENLSICAKGKMKQQPFAPEAVPGSAVNLRSKSSSSSSSVSSSSTSSSATRDRWSTLPSPEDQVSLSFPRRNPNILSFSTHTNLSKSISTSNIAGLGDGPLKGMKGLSLSTDNLHQGSKVNASTESLTDEGTEMMDSQLMGEFECDVKELEADSWSATVDKKFLKLHKKDEVKRQDVIYELFQTELHHVRTLKIMSEVYSKGIQKELQLDTHTLDKVFPMLDDLLDTHTHFLNLLLERKRTSLVEGRGPSSFLIPCIGDLLVHQFSGCNADRMKKVYGKFCSHHNEAVGLYKELLAKDKRFQALIKRLMSSSIVRRLSIPECVLLVTQRITKYPVLIQRILQHTKDTDEDHACVSEALRCVKELIAAVDSKVNEQEKKTRLREVYSRTDSKSIMRMKSGQMFAKEDLIRGRRKLRHDGTLQLKNTAGRLKDVHAMLLSDVLVFLQEKDQKYVFASLDQRSTVISLQKLIVREVANEERGLFLISAGTDSPEMVNVLASSKDERNAWMNIIQEAMHCIEKEDDEGVPSETEEDRRQQENRAKEIRERLRRKDQQIVSLLEEKVHIFKNLCDFNPALDETSPPIRERMLFRATPDEVTKGEPIIKDALKEVESLHTLVNSSVGGPGGSSAISLTGGTVGPVILPRRAETFGGFDSHQMNSSKSGEKEEGDDALDLRRTESDSVLKKGANTSLQMLLKRNNEVQHSVGNLHDLLTSLQAVVVQQDSFIEDQRLALSERLAAQPASRNSSSSSLSLASSSSSSRPSSLIEQEKQRSLERQRQEAASLQKQQAAHQEERRRREKEWEGRERAMGEREARLRAEEEAAARAHAALEEERQELLRRKEEYQRDLERLREAQRRLERDRETLRREAERLEALRSEESGPLQRFQRTPSTTSEDSLRFHSTGSLDQEPPEAKEVELSSSAPTKEPFLRIGSKRMGKNFNPFSSSSSSSTSSSSKAQGGDKECQLPGRLLQLAKAKGKKDKKKKGKAGERDETGTT